MQGIPGAHQQRLPFTKGMHRKDCRCPDCAPDAWRGIDRFRMADEFARAASDVGAAEGWY